jgi:gamma-glutamyltranspeptidase/glutathione hydrolase
MKGVVVSPEPLAVEAGARILEKGGTAFDAGIAAAVAEGVTNPFLCGLGGRGGFFCRVAGQEPMIIDCGGSIGSGERPKEWAELTTTRAEPLSGYRIPGDKGLAGYNQIVTPGFVKGLWTVYHKFGSGKFTWAELMEPSIRLCEEGFEVYPYIAQRWVEGEGRPGAFGLAAKLKKFPEFRRVYTKDGEAYRTGDILRQPDYGRTLRWIAKDGGDVFYKGELGDIIGADLEANGSFVTREDLRNYVTYEDQAARGWYRGYEVVSGSRGGPHVVEMLQILRHFDLASMELNSPAYVDLLSKAMLAGFHDTTGLAGDPPHSIKKILEQRAISPERAAWWADRIKTGQKIFGPTLCAMDAGTTSVSIIDGAGNIVAWTHSLGGNAGCGAVTPGLGFLLNDFLGHFNPAPNRWDSMVPGKRMHGGAQVMLFRDGCPFLALGAAGGSRQHTAILQTIVNVIDFGMSVEEAVKVSRIHHEQEGILLVEPGFPVDACAYMRDKGLKINDSATLSRVQAAMVEPLTGKMHGGVDPRGGAAIVVE